MTSSKSDGLDSKTSRKRVIVEGRKEGKGGRSKGREGRRRKEKGTRAFWGNTYFMGEVLPISKQENKLSFWLSYYCSHPVFIIDFYLSETGYLQIAHVGWNPWSQAPLVLACGVSGTGDTRNSSKINYIVCPQFPAPSLLPCVLLSESLVQQCSLSAPTAGTTQFSKPCLLQKQKPCKPNSRLLKIELSGMPPLESAKCSPNTTTRREAPTPNRMYFLYCLSSHLVSFKTIFWLSHSAWALIETNN